MLIMLSFSVVATVESYISLRAFPVRSEMEHGVMHVDMVGWRKSWTKLTIVACIVVYFKLSWEVNT